MVSLIVNINNQVRRAIVFPRRLLRLPVILYYFSCASLVIIFSVLEALSVEWIPDNIIIKAVLGIVLAYISVVSLMHICSDSFLELDTVSADNQATILAFFLIESLFFFFGYGIYMGHSVFFALFRSGFMPSALLHVCLELVGFVLFIATAIRAEMEDDKSRFG